MPPVKDCLFCRIASGEIPADIVFETPDLVAFRDISPQAPVHILIIPREHIPTTNDIQERHAALMGSLVLAAREIAGSLGISEEGYRLVFNCNKNAGQAVFHVHLHLLGGRVFGWPPG